MVVGDKAAEVGGCDQSQGVAREEGREADDESVEVCLAVVLEGDLILEGEFLLLLGGPNYLYHSDIAIITKFQ